MAIALRAGLPFGAVMATGAASAIAGLVGLPFAVQPLLWLAVAEAVFITVRGAIRHRGELVSRPREWVRIGPPAEHAGVLTVPLGLAVITAGLAGRGGLAGTALALAGLVLTWVISVIFVGRFAMSVGRARYRLREMDGGWFLAPAAILGSGIAAAAGTALTDPFGTSILRWMALGAAICGTAGYWGLMPMAAVRVVRLRGYQERPVLWWIWAGCGGLAAAGLSKSLETRGPRWGPAFFEVLRPAATTTWIAAALLVVPIVALSVRFLLGRPPAAPALPWPPTFSAGVFALGGLDVGALTGIGVIATIGKAAGYATLTGWLITAAWTGRALPHAPPPAAPLRCRRRPRGARR